MDYSEQLSYDQWMSLITDLKELPNFKLRVKSSPLDDLKLVYVLSKGRSMWDPEDTITFVVTETTAGMNVQSPKDEMFKKFVEVLFQIPMNRLPLLINERDETIKTLASWRLRNGV